MKDLKDKWNGMDTKLKVFVCLLVAVALVAIVA